MYIKIVKKCILNIENTKNGIWDGSNFRKIIKKKILQMHMISHILQLYDIYITSIEDNKSMVYNSMYEF